MKETKKVSKLSLVELIEELKNQQIFIDSSPKTNTQIEIGKITTDSRNVERGDIFIAYQGVGTDGHEFVGDVISKKPAMIVMERKSEIPALVEAKIPWILVSSGRGAWSILISIWRGSPQKKLKITGVTGTNGKSSTAWLVRSLLSLAGKECVLIGTLGIYFPDKTEIINHTTPDPDVLFNVFFEAVQRNIDTLVMEVSSHSIKQKRLLPVAVERAAFTSFSQDHLDFHSTMEDYFETKMELFRKYVKPGGKAIFSSSVPITCEVLEKTRLDSCIYGFGAQEKSRPLSNSKFYQTRVISSDVEKSRIIIETENGAREGTIPFFGRFFVENFSAALILAEDILGREIPSNLWEKVSQVPGRMERPVLGYLDKRPTVFVDYAHTPDALEKSLNELKPLCKGKLTVVFGCGGDRDRGKRPIMGSIAEKIADKVIVTNDNPRSEIPENIIKDILEGIRDRKKIVIQPDREMAICNAISNGCEGDVILIAGKGHETYQILGEKKVHFDDREIVRKYLLKDGS